MALQIWHLRILLFNYLDRHKTYGGKNYLTTSVSLPGAFTKPYEKQLRDWLRLPLYMFVRLLIFLQKTLLSWDIFL